MESATRTVVVRPRRSGLRIPSAGTLERRKRPSCEGAARRAAPSSKLVVVGLVSNGFSIADPADPGMLDVVGFDAAAPAVIARRAAPSSSAEEIRDHRRRRGVEPDHVEHAGIGPCSTWSGSTPRRRR
jgi:hypothetical protein